MADLTNVATGLLDDDENPILIGQNYVSVVDPTAIKFYGTKPMTIFTVDFGADASEEVGVSQAIGTVIRIIQNYCTIVIRGDLVSDQRMTFFVEIANDSQDWDNASGTEDTTLVEQIEADIVALGDTSEDDGWDFTAVTCTAVTSLDIVEEE
jgi:hypothetical protein